MLSEKKIDDFFLRNSIKRRF